jgi:selenocysteine-specific elongation factor
MTTRFHPEAESASQEKRIIIGTAGHIDHGKTALVYALTGTDTDRLPEEKQRGITIDLGFADLRLPRGDGAWLNLSLIDVPGHHAFVRNMLAGTGGIDCVMLVVAADEGVKPQTEEHLAICRLLGIRHGLVAITKVDAASADQVEATRRGVEALVAGTFLGGEPVVEVSALRGDGILELKSVLARVAGDVAARSQEQVPRIPLDRAFSVRGFGTVVTGTLQVGRIRAGEMLEQVPGDRLLRVRGLQVHGRAVQEAQAPCRVALNLADVEVAQIRRGDTLVPAQTLVASRTVDVELDMLPGAEPLKHGQRLRVHAFTADALARVLLFERNGSTDQGSGLARLRLAKPLLVVPGDRLVLRQCSPVLTVGGARVLDSTVPARIRKSTALHWLSKLQGADAQEQLRLRAERKGCDGISLASLVTETGFTGEIVLSRTQQLVSSGRLIECAEHSGIARHWIATEALERCVREAEGELAQAGSLSRAELRSRTRLSAEVFGAVLVRLSNSGKYEVAGEMVRAAARGDALPETMRARLQAIEDVYMRAGLAWPHVQDVSKLSRVSASELREAITLLLRQKKLVRMGADDAFVHQRSLETLYEDMRRHRGESFDVGRFKAVTGLTRKHAIPLLENLDQARVTRKQGDVRIVL